MVALGPDFKKALRQFAVHGFVPFGADCRQQPPAEGLQFVQVLGQVVVEQLSRFVITEQVYALPAESGMEQGVFGGGPAQIGGNLGDLGQGLPDAFPAGGQQDILHAQFLRIFHGYGVPDNQSVAHFL